MCVCVCVWERERERVHAHMPVCKILKVGYLQVVSIFWGVICLWECFWCGLFHVTYTLINSYNCEICRKEGRKEIEGVSKGRKKKGYCEVIWVFMSLPYFPLGIDRYRWDYPEIMTAMVPQLDSSGFLSTFLEVETGWADKLNSIINSESHESNILLNIKFY